VVGYVADDMAGMDVGRVVESGPAAAVMRDPKHPYTQALLAAAPSLEGGQRPPVREDDIDPPSPSNPPVGCHFADRCPHVMAQCRRNYPGVTHLAGQREVRCFLYSGKADE